MNFFFLKSGMMNLSKVASIIYYRVEKKITYTYTYTYFPQLIKWGKIFNLCYIYSFL